jgi:hypothetical protein
MPYTPAGNLQFNHETGFHGVVKIGTTPFDSAADAKATDNYANLATILATSGSVAIAHDPIVSQGIWGAGWYNAAEQVAYSNNVLKMTGSIGYELIVGNVFEALLSFGFNNRAASYGHGIVILPDGKNGFMGPGWCSQVDMNASTDSNVTGNIGYSSAILSRVKGTGETYEEMIGNNFITNDKWYDDDEGEEGAKNRLKIGVGVHPGVIGGAPGTAATGNQFLGMFPFWATSVHTDVLDDKGTSMGWKMLPNVQDWSAQYSSSVEFMTLCSGFTDYQGPITPDYIMIGSMQGSGSFTFVGLSSQISPESIYNQKSYKIAVRPNSYLSDNTKWGMIDLPSVIYNSVNIQTTSGSQLVTASVDVTALGDGSKPPMSFSKFEAFTEYKGPDDKGDNSNSGSESSSSVN